MSSLRSRARSRFTLIELVVVLAILVILAGGILVKLDVLQLRANKGVAASDMGGISRMVQTYVVANNHYPNRFDSLLTGPAGTLWGEGYAGAPEAYVGLDPQCVNGPGTTHQKLRVFQIPASPANDGYVNSLDRMGITLVHDLNAPTGFPSDAFVGGVARPIAANESFAVINAVLNGEPVATADGDAEDIMRSFYPGSTPPGTPPAGTKVFVFGLGKSSTIVGRSGLMMNPPMYANSADRLRYYARDLVCFEVSSGGSRARFLGALGADGDRLDEEITEFYDIQ